MTVSFDSKKTGIIDPAAVAITGGTIGGVSITTGKPKIRNTRIALPSRASLRSVMAVAPTVTVGTVSTMTSPFFLAAASGDGSRPLVNVSTGLFTYTKGVVSANSLAAAVVFNNLTTAAAPTYGSGSFGVSFMHDGAAFEIVIGQTSSAFAVKVDDQYVSLTPTSTGSTGGALTYAKYDFGTAKKRRIDIIGQGLSFNGVNIGATDAIESAPVRGPRCIVMGDSFTQTIVTSGGFNYVQMLADSLGWDDVWASGVGGTGYLNPAASATTFRGRVVHDVIQYAPEVVMVVGGINDVGYSAAAMGVEAALLFNQIRNALPNALILAAPNFNGGVNKTNFQAALANKNAVKAACIAAGGLFLDLLEFPLDTIPLVALLNQGYAAGTLGTAGIRLKAVPQPGMTIELGSGATLERLQVKTFSQAAAGIYNVFFDGTLKFTRVTDDVATQVGGSFWAGTGYVGALSGFGNSDRYVSSDGTHPASAGHDAMGQALTTLLLQALAPN